MPTAATVSERAGPAPDPAPAAAGWVHRLASARLGGLGVLALVLVALPMVFPNNYFFEVAILVALNAIVCVGLNLLIGYAGQISLGHAGFYALGAYGSAVLAARYGWPVWVSMPAAVAAVGVLAWLVGRPTLRLKGHYLAMATLGLGVIVSIVLANEDGLTGGPDGMAVPALELFGHAVRGEQVWYAIVGLALWLTVWFALNLIDSPIGRALRALHGSEVAAETVGIDSAHWKLRVFVQSALIAATAGALTAHYAGFITPEKASFLHSVELVIMVVFGGMASIWGAVVGAAVLTLLPQFLTVLKDYEMMAFGAILIVTMVFFPRGIVPTLQRLLTGKTRPDAARAERRAAPKPAVRRREPSTGRSTSGLTPPGDRPTYPSDEGLQ
ncbi:MAG: branched-chain amino acid ABC transporter permease [Rubrivivax sp.]|nr:branched-chain amino acid ABC transporter permease [Rubrivivax sp.]